MSKAISTHQRRALSIRITGVVQGVGFRPFVYRIAREHGVAGWVLNGEDGVHLVAEAHEEALAQFIAALRAQTPPAAQIASVQIDEIESSGFDGFEIRQSTTTQTPTVRISPDLAVCDDCLRELFDPADRRYGYPYINCTNCGPRYSIVLALPYDRPRTTMRDWPLCETCRREYEDPCDRRFHAQPIACPQCGPTYRLKEGSSTSTGSGAIARAAELLCTGAIVAVKGLGGYHLACDASNATTVDALRQRKYRKERPFAVMTRDLETARTIVELEPDDERVLTSVERPIVLARAKRDFEGVAPDNRDLGVMLPYTPLHHLLFAAGAPGVLVMTSGNRSSEPIAYLDEDALRSLAGIADAFLVGERPIARRIDDSIVRTTSNVPQALRRARGLAPRAVAVLPKIAPLLGAGGDLKSAITLVVDGQAFSSQHIGDLDHLPAADAFETTVRDLCAMYDVDLDRLTIAHDAHPGYHSTAYAQSFPGTHVAVQHHRAHVASVLAERAAWDTPVIGFAFDGTGYGDDGTIWGGEVFTGSAAAGLQRSAHLRTAFLPGGDAAARTPVQAAAGFLYDIDDGSTFSAAPFFFPERYAQARRLVAHGVRVFATSSMGRLFDTVAALVGFVREQSFEGQAAMWLEHLARSSGDVAPYAFPLVDDTLDFRPMLTSIVAERLAGRDPSHIARAFHVAVAEAVISLIKAHPAEQAVLSGGVFQNALLVEMLVAALGDRLWFNTVVPPNDGGLSLGQVALAAVGPRLL